MAHKFDPAKLARLEDPRRREMHDPARIFAELGLAPGSHLLDVGCGPGFFSLAAAPLLLPGGLVYAADVSEAMLSRLQERAAAAGIGNVRPVHSQESLIPLADGVAHAALMANVLHEVEDRQAILREIQRVMVPGGRLAVVEWRKQEMEQGPPLAERLAPEQTEAELRTLFTSITPLELSPTHYAFVASGDRQAPANQ